MSLSSSQTLDSRDGAESEEEEQEDVALLGKSPPPENPSNKITRIVFAVCFYLVVSLSMVFLNKSVLSKSEELKNAPLFFTWTQVVVAVFGCWLFGVLGRSVQSLSMFPPFEYSIDTAVKCAPATIAFCGMLVFNNLCLKYVEVSFYQVARSLTIPFNILLSGVFLSKWPSFQVVGTCAIIVSGYLAGIKGEMNFDRYGVFYGICSSMFVAGYSIFVKKAMKEVVDNSMERLMIYINVNSALILPLLFWWSGELSELKLEYFYMFEVWKQIVAAGSCGYLIGLATFLQIKETSPLTHNVSGTFKACLQTIIAVIWYQNPVSKLAATGFILVVGGSYAYSSVKRAEMAEADAEQKRSMSVDRGDVEDFAEKLSPSLNGRTLEQSWGRK